MHKYLFCFLLLLSFSLVAQEETESTNTDELNFSKEQIDKLEKIKSEYASQLIQIESNKALSQLEKQHARQNIIERRNQEALELFTRHQIQVLIIAARQAKSRQLGWSYLIKMSNERTVADVNKTRRVNENIKRRRRN